MSGRLLGITSKMLSDTNAQNLNFAVPVEYIDSVSEGAPEFTKDSADYYYAQGTINADKKNYEKAEEDFKNAIKVDKNYVNAYTSLSDMYSEIGRYDDEIGTLENARRLLPDDQDINLSLGNGYEDMSRYDDAIAAYKKVLASRPKDKDALYAVCLLGLITGRSEDVANYLPRLKQLNMGLAEEIELLRRRNDRQ